MFSNSELKQVCACVTSAKLRYTTLYSDGLNMLFRYIMNIACINENVFRTLKHNGYMFISNIWFPMYIHEFTCPQHNDLHGMLDVTALIKIEIPFNYIQDIDNKKTGFSREKDYALRFKTDWMKHLDFCEARIENNKLSLFV